MAKPTALTVYWTIGPMRGVRVRFAQVSRMLKKKEKASMSLVMTVTQECDAAAEFQDAQGHAAEVQNPTWGSSDVGIALVEASPDDPLKCVIKAAGSVGTAQVNIVGDADLGDGVREVSAVLDVEIKSAEAVSVIVNVGTPREQGGAPAATPGRKR